MEDFIVVGVEESDSGGVFDKKMPWAERAARIREMYPSTVELDWVQVFRQDPHILGRIIADIAKREDASDGRPGKRPSVDPKDAAQYLRRYSNDDYTILGFKEALNLLKGDRSVRAMAHKCDIGAPMMQRLLEGKARPTPEIMEKVARAYKKHPSYFVEYRISYIVGVLVHRMEAIPEASIVPYVKLRGPSEEGWR